LQVVVFSFTCAASDEARWHHLRSFTRPWTRAGTWRFRPRIDQRTVVRPAKTSLSAKCGRWSKDGAKNSAPA